MSSKAALSGFVIDLSLKRKAMHAIINPGKISGQVSPPPSKSQTLRAMIFAMLAKGKSTIYNYLPSPDTLAMISAIQSYGVALKTFKKKMEINGLGGELSPPKDIIDAQNSGIILRFIGAIAALNNTFSIITGDSSIQKNRVIHPLLDGLRQLNVYAESLNSDGHPPIIVKGPIQPNKISIDGQDSQPISALLIATSFAKGPSEILVKNPGETPWIDLTLSWFDRFHLKYENHHYIRYKISGGAKIKGFEIKIPSDFSSIAFPIAAALITNSEIMINNIDFDEEGGDKKFIEGIKMLGAKIEIDKKKKNLQVLKSGKLRGTSIDINDFIDSLPILGVLGCFCQGKTYLTNASQARFKESNRIAATTLELKKMQAKIEEREDGIVVEKSDLIGAIVNSHNDHRIAMSLCIAALGASGTTTINNVSCIDKSYPSFFEDLKKINVNLTLLP
jgi:3-phosphoshikimate 1-carboxyvinyltransferase